MGERPGHRVGRPIHVLPGQVDTSDKGDWNATADTAKVAAIKRRYKRTGKMKPVVMVRAPDHDRDVIVDGHHHFLAAEEMGVPVRAYVAHVPSRKGPWSTLATRQLNGKPRPRESVTGRLSKDEAGYAPAASPGVRCGTCSMFEDDRCDLVQGDIDPGAVCSQWQAEAPPATGVA